MDVVKLIRGVKCREPLWDRKHAYYHDRTVTMALWDDVAFSLGVDSETARTKWKGLRDTFRGELRKLHRTMIGGKPRKSTNWEYFDEMLFVKEQIYSNKRHLEELMNHKNKASPPVRPVNGSPLALLKSQSESSSSTGDDTSSHRQTDDSSSSSSDDAADGLDLTTTKTTSARPTQPQQKSSTNTTTTSSTGSDDGTISKDSSVPPSHKRQRDVEDDEDFNFLMSLLPQLRCLPTSRNLLVRLKMQEVLYNEIMASQNVYS